MIYRITGVLEEVGDGFAVVRAGDTSYQVHVPVGILEELRGMKAPDLEPTITFHTIHYIEGSAGHGQMHPRLIGFLNPVARDFFQLFITVQGIGPKRALRAISRPISDIARAIEEKDKRTLMDLPGVGGRAAEKIIAELAGKMARFALMREPGALPSPPEHDLADEVIEVLLQLGYKRSEARTMVDSALERRPDATTTEEVINEVFHRLKG